MKVRSLVAVSVVSVMASVGTASAMPVGSPDNPSLCQEDRHHQVEGWASLCRKLAFQSEAPRHLIGW